MKSSVGLIGAGFVALLAIWAGAHLYSIRHPHSPFARSPSIVSVPAGQASAPGPSDLSAAEIALPAPKIPDRLPAFTLNDLTGKATPILQWAGGSLVINFWATWCAPCRNEIPLLNALAAQWADRGVTFIGIAVDHPEKVIPFAERLKISYPLLVGEQDALDVAARLGVASPAFPFTVFTDRRGEVVALFVGELYLPQANLILSQVQALDQDRLPLAEARRAIAEGLAALAAG